jgi:S1-C subfamily serine protease
MWLTIRSGNDAGKRVWIDGSRLVIGRDEGCDLVLHDVKVSRNHAHLQKEPSGQLVLHDLGSTNGTYVDGRRISGPTVLKGNEQLRFGDTLVVVSEGEEGEEIGESGTASRKPGTATVERQALRRSVRRASILAAGAIVTLLAILALFLTGVLPPKGKPDIPEIVAAVKPSTVLVLIYQDGEEVGNGSGWVFDASKGFIVTNAHVIAAGNSFAIGIQGDKRPAAVVGVAPCEDLAVLKVSDTSGLKTLPLASQSELQQGDMVVAMGYPVNASLEENLVATAGVISVIREQYKYPALDVPAYTNVIQTTAPINPGNSGGPLVNQDEKLVGVNSAGFDFVGNSLIQGQGYAIGVDRVKEIVPSLAQGHSVGWAGMDFDYPDKPVGIRLIGAVAGTPAAKSGFEQVRGLYLIDINGQPIDNTLRSYCDVVRNLPSGAKATFTVTDGNRQLDVRVTFA